VGTDFSTRLELPAAVGAERRLFFYPGSSIGNFAPDEAVAFLRRVRERMDQHGALWIGADLQKDRGTLVRAYDDGLGVTAAFNRNILRHANALAGTDFAPADWRHVARYDEQHGRIEMHLEAERNLTVRWPGGERAFAQGERIHTENSYKYTPDGFRALLERAGLRQVGMWTDAKQWFGFVVAVPA
ncbi:MAG: L-histidine N(alpha)-methyltransferase, partial [Planctomycetes bacterium]|nr:L-histidine N(alpha)-methyltransferase [Planctomycetota bacterium]